MTSQEAMFFQLKKQKGRPLRQILTHIFTYFWVPIVIVAAVLVLLVSMVVTRVTRKAPALTVCCINAAAQQDADARVALAVALPRFLRIALLIAGVFVFGWLQLWFGYLSRFEDTNKVLLRNTLRMAAADIFRTLLLAVLAVAVPVSSYILLLWMPPAGGPGAGHFSAAGGKGLPRAFQKIHGA